MKSGCIDDCLISGELSKKINGKSSNSQTEEKWLQQNEAIPLSSREMNVRLAQKWTTNQDCLRVCISVAALWSLKCFQWMKATSIKAKLRRHQLPACSIALVKTYLPLSNLICLFPRTNVVQSLLARKSLQAQCEVSSFLFLSFLNVFNFMSMLNLQIAGIWRA